MHFYQVSTILEPFILSLGSSNQVSSSESPLHSYNYYSYRLVQAVFNVEVEMAFADMGPVNEGFVPHNPIDVNLIARTGSEGSVNQGEISSDHTESFNLGEGRDGNGAFAQLPMYKLLRSVTLKKIIPSPFMSQ